MRGIVVKSSLIEEIEIKKPETKKEIFSNEFKEVLLEDFALMVENWDLEKINSKLENLYKRLEKENTIKQVENLNQQILVLKLKEKDIKSKKELRKTDI